MSLLLLPDFHGFYAIHRPHLLFKVALFGAMWGVGNVSYGLTMRHLGMSLGIGVAIGVDAGRGHAGASDVCTDRPRAVYQHGRPADHGRRLVVAVIGVAIVSYAGHQKEMQLRGEAREFNVKLGLVSRRAVRHLFVRHVICDGCGTADEGRGA